MNAYLQEQFNKIQNKTTPVGLPDVNIRPIVPQVKTAPDTTTRAYTSYDNPTQSVQSPYKPNPLDHFYIYWANRAWMPSLWRTYLRNQIGKPVVPSLKESITNIPKAPIEGGELLGGAAQGVLKLLGKVFNEADKILTPPIWAGFQSTAQPFVVFAAFNELMKGKPYNAENITSAVKQSFDIAKQQSVDSWKRIDWNNTDQEYLLQSLPQTDELKKQAEVDLANAKTPIERNLIIAKLLVSSAATAPWSKEAKGPVAGATKMALNIGSSPSAMIFALTGAMRVKPPVKITPKDIADARNTLGIKGAVSKEVIDQKFKSLLKPLQEQMNQLGNDPLSTSQITANANNLMRARSILLNTETTAQLGEKLNYWQRAKAILNQPIFGTHARGWKYPIQGFIEPPTISQIKKVQEIKNQYKLDDMFLDTQARIVSGKGGVLNRIHTGWGIDGLDKENAQKLIQRLSTNVDKKGNIRFYTPKEYKEIQQSFPEMSDVINDFRKGNLFKGVQGLVKRLKTSTTMRGISPELYFPANKANIKATSIRRSDVSFLNNFVDKYKITPRLSKLATQVMRHKNREAYLDRLVSKGTITLSERSQLSQATKEAQSWFDSYFQMIKPIADKYHIKFRYQQGYLPGYVEKDIQTALNRQGMIKGLRVDLSRFKLDEDMLDTPGLPTSLHAKVGKGVFPKEDDLIVLMDKYSRSMSKFVGLKDFDAYAMKVIPQMPLNVQPLAIKYLNYMRASKKSGWMTMARGIANYEYFKNIGFSIRTAMKNALQTSQDMASLRNPDNYRKAVEMLGTKEGDSLVNQMGVLNVNLRSTRINYYTNFADKTAAQLQKIAYGFWQTTQKYNYKVSALSHYLDGLDMGLSQQQALQYGLEQGVLHQYGYNKANSLIIDFLAPKIGRMTLFKKWPLSQLQMFSEWWTQGNKLAILRYVTELNVIQDAVRPLGIDITSGMTALQNLATRGPLIPGVEDIKDVRRYLQYGKPLSKIGKVGAFTKVFLNRYIGRVMEGMDELIQGKVISTKGLVKESSKTESLLNALWSSYARNRYWEFGKRTREVQKEHTREKTHMKDLIRLMALTRDPKRRKVLMSQLKKYAYAHGLNLNEEFPQINQLLNDIYTSISENSVNRVINKYPRAVKRQILEGNF